MNVKVETDYYPRLTEWHVRQVLKWMNPLDLTGIDVIRLRREAETDSKTKIQSDYLRSPVCVGVYFKSNPKVKSAGRPHITIYTRPFYYGTPSLFKYSPVATVRMAFVLAHEVGHHLVARRGYVYEPTEPYKPDGIHDERQEGVANRYAVDLVRSMSARWYYRFGHWLGNEISRWYYELGAADWKKGAYERAASNWFCSHSANPENHEAAVGYKQALARLNPAQAKFNKALHLTAR